MENGNKMTSLKKVFGGIELTWPKIIIMAVVMGAYTAAMAIIPIFKNTSFNDITVTFEVWIFFGIFIIMNSKSAKDAALKNFVFFLISQPLIYLIQVPFTARGFGLFSRYPYWFAWTVFTVPMSLLGYQMKKDKWWGIFILTPMLIILADMCLVYTGKLLFWFPHHLITVLFCIASMFIYVIGIFTDKKAIIIGMIINVVLLAGVAAFAIIKPRTYDTVLMVSGGETGLVFDDTYKAYITDPGFGDVEIVYEENLEDYMVEVSFKKGGHSKFVLESPEGEKHEFNVDVRYDTFDFKEII